MSIYNSLLPVMRYEAVKYVGLEDAVTKQFQDDHVRKYLKDNVPQAFIMVALEEYYHDYKRNAELMKKVR